MTAIELRHLRAFVAVAGDLHLEQAAGRLELSQVDDLEGIVGAQLVDRRQRTVGLTGAGRELLPVARSALRRCRRRAPTSRSGTRSSCAR